MFEKEIGNNMNGWNVFSIKDEVSPTEKENTEKPSEISTVKEEAI